jgi:PilZ domain
MSSRGIERRRQPRCDFSDTIDFCIKPFALDETPFHGLILNISESGLCLYTSNSLNVGQELIIKTTLRAPVVKATIRWVRKYRDDLFRIGATFTE